jgi:hypothetical protein
MNADRIQMMTSDRQYQVGNPYPRIPRYPRFIPGATS